MHHHPSRRRSRWLSLITATALAPALCAQSVAPAPASPARKEDSVKLEKYVVTGSLIKRLEGEGALPVVTLTPDELEEKVQTLQTVLAAVDLTCLAGIDVRVSNTAVVTRVEGCG
jgi:hypothetical protein